MKNLAVTVLLWLGLAFFRLALLVALALLIPFALLLGLLEYGE